MKRVGLAEAGASLAELCQEVARSRQDVVIEQGGLPLVRISPLPVAPGGVAGSPVWDAVREWEARNPDDVDFEPVPRIDADRNTLGDYWK